LPAPLVPSWRAAVSRRLRSRRVGEDRVVGRARVGHACAEERGRLQVAQQRRAAVEQLLGRLGEDRQVHAAGDIDPDHGRCDGALERDDPADRQGVAGVAIRHQRPAHRHRQAQRQLKLVDSGRLDLQADLAKHLERLGPPAHGRARRGGAKLGRDRREDRVGGQAGLLEGGAARRHGRPARVALPGGEQLLYLHAGHDSMPGLCPALSRQGCAPLPLVLLYLSAGLRARAPAASLSLIPFCGAARPAPAAGGHLAPSTPRPGLRPWNPILCFLDLSCLCRMQQCDRDRVYAIRAPGGRRQTDSAPDAQGA
jgi:hypothetical protein